MKTILVPTDFSETSIKAVKYAFGLAKQVQAKKIVLFNVFSAPMNTTIDPLVMGIGIMDYELLEGASLEGLQYVKEQLMQNCPDGVEIEFLTKYGLLSENINLACDEVEADVIVMGITGGSIISEKLFGSNTTMVARCAKVPVIIVPPSSTYHGIKKLVLVSDFVAIEEFVPLIPIKKVLDDTKAQLMVLHVASSKHHSLYEGAYECFSFKEMFEEYNPAFHFVVNSDFTGAINTFAAENQADIVMVIPKKHSFISSIFTTSHTKDLAFHSNIPLMAVHEV